METNRIRQFCTVAETVNLRKAADILHLSHSALSKSLKLLQIEIDQKLLIQSGRNILLTDEGRAFYIKAQEFLKQEAVLLTKEVNKLPVVKIGTFEVFSTHILGSYWHNYFPESDLELRELLPGKMEHALIDHQVDYAITFEPIAMKDIDYIRVGKMEMGIFVKKGSFKNVDIEDLPFVAPVQPIEGTPSGSKGLDGWPDDKIKRTIKYKVDMMESGLALARQGVAAIYLPTCVAKTHNLSVNENCKLVNYEKPQKLKTVKRDVFILKRQNTEENSQLRNLAKLIRHGVINV